MITAEQVEKMLVELTTGKPPTLKGPEAERVRKQLKKEIAEIQKNGGTVAIPHEIPE